MYQIKCDNNVLYDPRGASLGLVVTAPKATLETNTVGGASFTIYSSHPYYDAIRHKKSVIEFSDEYGVFFRGRTTEDTVDFNNGKAIDIEGAMAFFNDSIVRPFAFPDDFLEDADYIAAAESGNVIAFFLQWLIDNHNSQTSEFQHMKLGNVTVSDSNNYLSRSNTGYASTWETLKSKLFESSLGGYLCIRYEADGNYIDYLSEFTETNPQKIVFGENLLDLKSETDGTGIYTAIIPLGKDKLTIKGLADGVYGDDGDIVKSGDTLYSKSGVEEYGWIYAPTAETTWADVTSPANLLTKGVAWFPASGFAGMNTLEATAADLHFSNAEIASFRIYRNVAVESAPHKINTVYPLTKLEIDLLNPQNTKIRAGGTKQTFTGATDKKVDAAVTESANQVKEFENSLYYPDTVLIDGSKIHAKTINVQDLFAQKITSPLDESVYIDLVNAIITASKIIGNGGGDSIQIGYDANYGYGLRYFCGENVSFEVFPNEGNTMLILHSEGKKARLWYQAQNGIFIDVENADGTSTMHNIGEWVSMLGLELGSDSFSVRDGQGNAVSGSENDLQLSGKKIIGFFTEGSNRGYVDSNGFHGWWGDSGDNYADFGKFKVCWGQMRVKYSASTVSGNNYYGDSTSIEGGDFASSFTSAPNVSLTIRQGTTSMLELEVTDIDANGINGIRIHRANAYTDNSGVLVDYIAVGV